MNKQNNKVLCFVNMNAHYQVLKDIALELQLKGEASISFYFYSYLFDLSKEISDAKDCGFNTIEINKFDKSNMSFTSYKPIDSTVNIKNDLISLFFKKTVEMKRKFREIQEDIYKTNPRFVLIADNSINYDIPLFIKACYSKDISIFNIPFGVVSPEITLERIKKSSYPRGNDLMKMIISRIIPKYVYRSNGNSYLPLPSTSIASLELLKAGLKRPWAWNASDITGVFVDSVFSKELNLNQGLPMSKMISIKSIEMNNQNYSSKEEFIRKSSLNPNLPLLLFNIPAPLLGLINLKGCEFSNPKSVVNAFFDLPESIKKYTNLVWTLHPRLKKEDYLFVERMGIKIIETPGAKIIPFCDIFIGSDSTLFKTALSMSKPVINYQVFGLTSEIFANEKGYFNAKNQDQYQSIIDRLVNNKMFYNEVVQQIKYTRFGNDMTHPLIHEYLIEQLN